jgi:hypothetical protein
MKLGIANLRIIPLRSFELLEKSEHQKAYFALEYQ